MLSAQSSQYGSPSSKSNQDMVMSMGCSEPTVGTPARMTTLSRGTTRAEMKRAKMQGLSMPLEVSLSIMHDDCHHNCLAWAHLYHFNMAHCQISFPSNHTTTVHLTADDRILNADFNSHRREKILKCAISLNSSIFGAFEGHIEYSTSDLKAKEIRLSMCIQIYVVYCC